MTSSPVTPRPLPPGGDVAVAPHAARADRRALARHRETGSDVIVEEADPRVDRRPAADHLAPAVHITFGTHRAGVIRYSEITRQRESLFSHLAFWNKFEGQGLW